MLPLPQPNYSMVMQLQTDDNASVSDFLALISAAQLTHFVLDSRMTSLVNNWLQILCLYLIQFHSTLKNELALDMFWREKILTERENDPDSYVICTKLYSHQLALHI